MERRVPILQKEGRETAFSTLCRSCEITADTVHSADTDSKVLIASIKREDVFLSL